MKKNIILTAVIIGAIFIFSFLFLRQINNSTKFSPEKEELTEIAERSDRHKDFEPNFNTPGPPLIIYKTKGDYNELVPVELSEDKSMIASAPGKSDIYINGEYAYPTQIGNGYLLDNRGIYANTAFLNLTYEDFMNMSDDVDFGQLMKLIKDDDPFVKMYDCGAWLWGDNEEKKNMAVDIIRNNQLHKCKYALKPKIRTCPDEKIVNKMPGSFEDSIGANDYFILDGERREISEFDYQWVEENCNLKEQEVW